MIERYARSEEAQFEFSHFSLAPTTSLAAVAADAAGEQGRQWQYIDLFMRNSSPPAGTPTRTSSPRRRRGPRTRAGAWEEDPDGAETVTGRADEGGGPGTPGRAGGDRDRARGGARAGGERRPRGDRGGGRRVGSAEASGRPGCPCRRRGRSAEQQAAMTRDAHPEERVVE